VKVTAGEARGEIGGGLDGETVSLADGNEGKDKRE
jgi:hypothetical protein